MFADVIFPLRLPPLTYRVPDQAGISPSDLKGRIVRAPLSKKSRFGVVIEARDTADCATSGIRDILSIHEPFASGPYLHFLKWLSEYYLAPMGMALKSAFFEEAVADLAGIKRRESKKRDAKPCGNSMFESDVPFPDSIVDAIAEHISSEKYSAMLYHAPDMETEISALLEVLRRSAGQYRGYIILVPETSLLNRMAQAMESIFGRRLCTLHSKLGKKERSGTILDILSGRTDVVLGTRSAALAPLPELSFVAVIGEHSPAYKGEEGLHYNARDLAVMRGFMEKKCVLLSSVCPSLESGFNAIRGKYIRLNRLPLKTEESRPRIKIVTFKTGKQSQLSLAPEVVSHAQDLLRKNEQILFMVGRKGYSLIRCEDCGHIEICSKCATPMLFYRSTGMLKCHHCGGERRNPELCEECGGSRLQSFSAGTERVREEVSNLLKSPALLIEKPKIASSKADGISDNSGLTDFVPLVVGTSMTKRRICSGYKYSAAVLMNIDLLMAQPDFRAYERAFQEIVEVSQMVKSDGILLIQTKSPGSKVLKCLRHYDFESFREMELAQRRDLDYPPYARMILFTVLSRRGGTTTSDIWRAVRDMKDPAVCILGPIEAPSGSKSYEQAHQILLKSRDNRRLHEMAKALLAKLETDRRIKVVVVVDPIKI